VTETAVRSQIAAFESAGGAQVYRLPLEAFPNFWVHAYLVFTGEYCVLIDCGTNFHNANQHLEDGLAAVEELRGEPVTFEDLTHILITHGHIDHFGGLAYLESRTQARIGVHELDRRNLTNFEERLVIVSRALREFLLESGLSEEATKAMLDMYLLPKALITSVRVDFTYEQIGMALGPFEFLHVPGHGAGQVCIRLHDLLFSADHVIGDISPHMAPERLSLTTGLAHYLASLKALAAWAPDVRLTLPGHNDPIVDLSARIADIRQGHAKRLERVLDLLAEPRTTAGVSKQLFGIRDGYNALLAVEETGAHIEYLYQHGLLAIHNLPQIQSSIEIQPIEYLRLGDAEIPAL
jgi:glyoxylase-like metal-dependent hydrolase (beta-lactamase superfamily II)